MSPLDGRKAFPCFDEPRFKAKFSIRMVRQSGDGYRVLSNMNVKVSSIQYKGEHFKV